jgi:hypothetical protein
VPVAGVVVGGHWFIEQAIIAASVYTGMVNRVLEIKTEAAGGVWEDHRGHAPRFVTLATKEWHVPMRD